MTLFLFFLFEPFYKFLQPYSNEISMNKNKKTALEKTIRDSKIQESETIINKSVQILAYADGKVLINRTITDLKETFLRLEKSAMEMGLCINEIKTKLIIVKSTKPQYRPKCKL